MANLFRRSWVFRIFVTLGVLLVAIIPVHAAIITVPDGLSLGDQYRLAFVTTTITKAHSWDIGYYNYIVNFDVNGSSMLSGLGATWTAIASTAPNPSEGAHARYNTFTNTEDPNQYQIYNLQGELIAENYNSLWGSEILTPIQYDRDGNTVNTLVWTGTAVSGFSEYGFHLGSDDFDLGYGVPVVGDSSSSGPEWIRSQYGDWSNGPFSTEDYPLYALSSPITVVPVPPAIWLLGSALIALLGIRRRGRKP